MRWAPAAVLGAFAAPPGYELAQASAADVPALIAFWNATYPGLAVGEAAHFLDPAFYAQHVHLTGTCDELPTLALLARREGHVVAALTLDKQRTSLSGGVGAVAPLHRASALGLLGPRLLEAFGRAMGAELLQYFATLQTRHQQVIAERFGFTAVGIVPASDRDVAPDGQVRRVYEVLYVKVLAAPAQIVAPTPACMTARTRALYIHLFP